MRLEGFDVVFGLATPAIDLFIEHASVSLVQVGDNEARVGPLGASLDAGDDALDAAPAFGAVEELLEAAYFVVSWRSLEASLRAGLEDFDVSAQGRGWRNAEDVIEAVRPTPVENLGAAVMAVGPQQDLGVGPVGADGAHETAQEGLDLLAAGPFGGPKDGGDADRQGDDRDQLERPSLLRASAGKNRRFGSRKGPPKRRGERRRENSAWRIARKPAPMKNLTTKRGLRCAIYTRVSTDQGLRAGSS